MVPDARLVVFVVALISSSLVSALDFSIHSTSSKTVNAIAASGRVENDDVGKFNAFLSTLPTKRHTIVHLDSRGGTLEGAIKLGIAFKRQRIRTAVAENKTCSSACAFMFFGGTDNQGNQWMAVPSTSKLGVHSFKSKKACVNPEQTQKVVSMMLEYGDIVDIPLKVFVLAFETSNSIVYVFKDSELQEFGIKIWDSKRQCYIGETC